MEQGRNRPFDLDFCVMQLHRFQFVFWGLSEGLSMMLNPALKHREAWICRRAHTSGRFPIRGDVCLWRLSHPVRDGSAIEW